jgi:hypothetical protein
MSTSEQSLFGKVDQVPGRFFVATLFSTYLRVPVRPLQSYLVIEDGSQKAIPLPINIKSICFLYVRWTLLLIALWGGGGLVYRPFGPWFDGKPILMQINEIRISIVLGIFLAAGSLLLMFFSFRLSRANSRRIQDLARIAAQSPFVCLESTKTTF